MTKFCDHIHHVLEIQYDFPDRFDNEIFYTEVTRPVHKLIEYTSNFSIKYIISGEEDYTVNGQLKKVEAGKMLIVNDQSDVINAAGISHAISIFISRGVLEDCRNNLLSSEETLLDEPLNKSGESVTFYDEVSPQEIPALRKLENILSRSTNVHIPSDYYYELAESLLISQNEVFRSINSLKRQKFSTRKEIYLRINEGIDYINDHLEQKFDLEELAGVCCMSKFHFIRCFRQIYGTTPNRYYIIRKMEKAKRILLSDQHQSVSELAFQFGYPDIASFSKQFKQIYRESPQAWRKFGHNDSCEPS